MKVYIEFFVIDNVVTTSLASCLSYNFIGIKIRRLRVLIVTVAGTLVSVFYPFWSLPTPLIVIAKLLIGMILSLILFAGIFNIAFGALSFFGATALLGGACIAADCFISGDLGLALSSPSRLPYCLPSAVSLVIYIPARCILSSARKRRAESSYGYDVYVTIGNRTVKMRGYLDTGNGLEEDGIPIAVTKLNVFLNKFGADALEAAYAEKTVAGIGDAQARLILVKPDKFLLYLDKKRNKYSDVILGITASGFRRTEDMLLPVSVLGG